MAEFKGDVTKFNPKQLEFIAKVLKEEGFEDARVTIKNVGEAGDNYAANVKRIVAEKDGKTLRMVAKVAPTLEKLRSAMYTNITFRNEYVMYSKVLSKFAAIEEAAGVPVNERLRFAKFYGAIMEEPLEMILLEDLQIAGFVILDRFKPLSDQAMKLVLRDFAKLHSCSYALKNQEPNTFREFCENLVNPWILLTQDENNKEYFESIEGDAVNALSSDKYKDALKNTASKSRDMFRNLYEVDSKSRYSVIQQGDCWTNNIMFKLQDSVPTECCMIDYQVSRANIPVADLHYMIFICTDYESRAKHFHEWIDYYHSELDRNLLKFGLKSDDCYPREQLDADLKRHGKLSLVNIIMVAPALTRQSAEAAQMKDTLDLQKVMKVNTAASEATMALFRTKIAETIDSLLELGYI